MEKIFKAKRLDNSEWVEFNLEDIRGNNFVYLDGLGMLNVDLKNCCQYTGINDSEGNRIFEGDYLHDSCALEMVLVSYCNLEHCVKIGGVQVSKWCLPDLTLTGHNIHDRG